MAGVGKLLKQAQKMQKQMEGIQSQLAEQIIEVSSGGGAINIKINGQGEFQAFKIDPEFLKEDAEFIEETLLGAVQGAVEPLCWLILLAVFITDATWTLLWRICAGQKFTQPHRLHAYQRLSRYWDSHLKVDVMLILINLLWLFPLALLLQLWPHHYLILVILAYLPLLCGMVKIGRVA